LTTRYLVAYKKVLMTPPPRKPHPGRLPRLPREFYQGDAFVHWSLATHDRATGWLTPNFHARFRELMLHAAAREGLFCSAYCLMPDHLHLVWMGLRHDSDQFNGMSFLRTHLEPALTPVGDEVTSRFHDPTKHSSRRVLQPGSAVVGDDVKRRSGTVGDEVTSHHPLQGNQALLTSCPTTQNPPVKFQPQAHDSVLREAEREHGAFARVCFYILNNPVKAELVSKPEDWEHCGAVVPGYPTLHPLVPGFWDKLWKLYAQHRHPDAGDIKKPRF
jgi:REP element-mobilizing transposase RayT